MTQDRTNFSKEIAELLKETYGKSIYIFQYEIPYSIKGAEMRAYGKSIFSFELNGKIEKAYENLTKEILEIERQRKKANIDIIR